MDKRTKIKVTVITVIGVLISYAYIQREQIKREFEYAQLKSEWAKHEPKGQLIDGKKYGEWLTYFKNGNVAKVATYINDTLHGKNVTYRPTGEYYIRCYYNKGILVDSFLLYHPNGVLNSEEFLDSLGKSQGIFKIYFDNGRLSQIGKKIDGQFDGEFRSFYESGRLKNIEHYTLGERTGTWIFFEENGDTIKIERY